MPQLLGRTRPFSARFLSLLEAGPANRHCVREMLRLAEGSSTSFSTRLQRVKCNALTGKISSRVQTRKVLYCASNLEVTSVVHLAERLRGPLVNIARTVFFPHGARVRCGCGFMWLSNATISDLSTLWQVHCFWRGIPIATRQFAVQMSVPICLSQMFI